MAYREVRKATRELRKISTSQIEDMKIGDITNATTADAIIKVTTNDTEAICTDNSNFVYR